MRGEHGRALIALSLVGMCVAAYLTWTKLSGTPPACAIAHGCETIEQSQYSTVLGIPVAAFGAVGSAVTLGGALLWWRRRDRRALIVTYLIGLASLPVLAYLLYLELAVINAVCAWCVTYSVITIAAWAVSTAALVQTRGEVAET